MTLYLIKSSDHTFPVDADSEGEALTLYRNHCIFNDVVPDPNAKASRATAFNYRTLQDMVAATFSKRLWLAESDDGNVSLYAITRDDAWGLLAEKYDIAVADVRDGGDWNIRAFNEDDFDDMVGATEDAEMALASLRSRLSDIAEEG